MLTKLEKSEQIKDISNSLGKAKAAFVVDFQGMTVEQITVLRKSLSKVNCEMKVVKNTLALRALKEYPESEKAISDVFTGTNAFVFAFEDVSASAKALTEYGKDNETFKLKSGVFDGEKLDANKIKFLSTLPSKNELRAQLLSVFMAPATSMVRVLNAAPSGFLNVLNAYKDTKDTKN